jgi:hypothetical protein
MSTSGCLTFTDNWILIWQEHQALSSMYLHGFGFEVIVVASLLVLIDIIISALFCRLKLGGIQVSFSRHILT